MHCDCTSSTQLYSSRAQKRQRSIKSQFMRTIPSFQKFIYKNSFALPVYFCNMLSISTIAFFCSVFRYLKSKKIRSQNLSVKIMKFDKIFDLFRGFLQKILRLFTIHQCRPQATSIFSTVQENYSVKIEVAFLNAIGAKMWKIACKLR